MVENEMEFVGWEALVDRDDYFDVSAKAESIEFDEQKYAKMLEENDHVDGDYKAMLLCILTKKSRTKSLKKRREKHDDDDDDVRELDSDRYTDEEEANDPHYALFLKSLRAHEKSYVVVKDERDGLPFVIKYEGDESSDKVFDLDYKRKLRSATKQNNGPSDERKHDSQSTSTKEAENLSRKKLRSRAKISTDEIVQDPDYLTFMRKLKVVEDRFVYEYGAHTVVYEANDGESNHEREEHSDDGWAADVEFLDSATFYKEGNSNPSMEAATDGLGNSEFRRQLIAVLGKPYDKEEYDKLWGDIKFRVPEMRHIELRHGRDRSCSTDKYGKSYLDHHPDLGRQLSRLHDDEPKRLNLLRGFFFWLEKASHNGSFHPWQDAECLFINPEIG